MGKHGRLDRDPLNRATMEILSAAGDLNEPPRPLPEAKPGDSLSVSDHGAAQAFKHLNQALTELGEVEQDRNALENAAIILATTSSMIAKTGSITSFQRQQMDKAARIVEDVIQKKY